jgi:hypothetical protein
VKYVCRNRATVALLDCVLVAAIGVAAQADGSELNEETQCGCSVVGWAGPRADREIQTGQ